MSHVDSKHVNDFVVKFANVNGSGSASANRLFAKSILRMGVPVSSRNIFPSNIQGLPTWYEVRVSRGGLSRPARRRRPDGRDEPADLGPGRRRASSPAATCSTIRPSRCRQSKFRDDITVIGVPLTEICNRDYTDPRQRQLFKNIIYVGALSALLDIDVAEIEQPDRRAVQGQGQADRAQHPGPAHGPRLRARRTCECPLGLRVERADEVGDRIFIDGNSAAALGCVYGGATVAAWYPITPSTSLAEAFAALLPALPHRSRDRQEPLRHRPGRGRARLDRHGDRRGAGTARAPSPHLRPRHLADAGVHRPRLLRRDPGGDLRRPARRPVDRHADAHAAVRHPRLRLRLARRHQARAAVPRGPERVLRVRGTGLRPRRPAADADLRACSTSTSA